MQLVTADYGSGGHNPGDRKRKAATIRNQRGSFPMNPFILLPQLTEEVLLYPAPARHAQGLCLSFWPLLFGPLLALFRREKRDDSPKNLVLGTLGWSDYDV